MYRKVGVVLIAIGIFLLITVKFVGFTTQGSVPSSVTIIQPVTETPSAASTGGGGGGGSVSIAREFSVEPELIKVTIKQGETKREVVRITNNMAQLIEVDVKAEVVNKFMAISSNSFILEPGQSRDLAIDFFARENELPDVHVGSIIVKGNDITKIINVIVEVKPRLPLFDVATKLAKSEVIPGENIVSEISIINMGDLEGFDVNLHYAIRNFNGDELVFREESLAIEKELTVVRQLNVPSTTSPGTYIFYARASYGESVAAGSESFIVKEIALAPLMKSRAIWSALLIALLLIIILLLWKRKKKKKPTEADKEKVPEIVYVGGKY